MNQVIKEFLDGDKITQYEYDILFENKSSWYIEDRDGNKNWSESQKQNR